MRAILALINNLGIVSHQYCSSSYLDYCQFPAVKYKADHGAKFVCLARLPLYNKLIAKNTTTIVCICVEAAHKS